MAKKKKAITNINQCQFGGTVTLSSAQSNNVTNSVFNGPLLTGLNLKTYNESGCFRKGSHQMYKAINVSCPCTDEIPFAVSSARNKQEVRIYFDDVVLLNSKGELAISLHDTMDLVKQQQKTIEKLAREVKHLKGKLKK